MAKYGLGRGLGSLIPKKNDPEPVHPMEIEDFEDNDVKNVKEEIIEISVGDIQSNPWQPRTNFDKAKLQELVDSIREHGIIQPLIVTKAAKGYQLVAGERRLKSARILGMFRVPSIVRDMNDMKKLELAVIENVQRSDLNVLEESDAYHRLMEEFDLTQDQVAKKVGKSRPTVANILRLKELPEAIKKSLNNEKISFGHAKILLSLDSEKKQRELLKRILVGDLNVREAEDEVKKVTVRTHKRIVVKDANLSAKEEELRNHLNTKVKISDKSGKGNISIDYYSKEELGDILEKILKA
jgi:ParB family transcriptional regulator, chromosome partitioning protein